MLTDLHLILCGFFYQIMWIFSMKWRFLKKST